MQTTQAANVVAQLYHDWITGLVLTLVSKKDAATAEQFVFSLFRRQHLEKFLPGLLKLNLADEPHAVAAAKYHYFSNQLGGVKVEYLQESEKKAWVRYPPPRWIWTGTAICGIPGNVNRAMLHGWHAHNGVTLENPRLGFVCTKTTVDGQPGLEGYYQEYDHDLKADQRLVFAPEEVCPPIRTADLPDLDSALWPDERKAKAYRNYSMEYIKTALPVLTEMLGPEESRHLGRICALQIGMHSYDRAVAELGITGDTPNAFADLLATLLTASGDDISRDGSSVTQHSWRLFRDRQIHASVTDQWLALFEGMLSVHDRFAHLNRTDVDGGVRFDITGGGRG